MSEEEAKFTFPPTSPYNQRFPNTNQTKNCWINYVDYFRCVKHYDGENPKCEQFKVAYNALCPNGWTSAWDEQRDQGRFPVKI